MFKTLAAAALAAGIAAAPAAAQVFDASASFTTVQGNGGFTYGSFDGSSFALFDSTSNCIIGNVICLRSSAVALPSAFKPVAGAPPTSGTVILTPGKLILHPGEFADSVFVAWTAPNSRTYSYTAQFNQQDTGNGTNPHSVGITEFYTPFGGATQFFPVGVVDTVTTSILTGFTTALGAGDTIGYIIDKDGVFFNDSTGVDFTVTAVPEPASWALMITGFGLVGGALRRRAVTLAA